MNETRMDRAGAARVQSFGAVSRGLLALLLVASVAACNPSGGSGAQPADPLSTFEAFFDAGDELFERSFTLGEGGGAVIDPANPSVRFTVVPRRDLTEWATTQGRITGPSGHSCLECHNVPVDDGASSFATLQDVSFGATATDPAKVITRTAPHLFGSGAVQRLAEEITVDLQRIADNTANGTTENLVSKGVSFGTITRSPGGTLDTSGVEGVSPDLIVRPLKWKGVFSDPVTVRGFARAAAHQDMGVQAVELFGDGVDNDGDGVTDELSIDDITALTIYMAAQPRPTTRRELFSLGLIQDAPDTVAIQAGEARFTSLGCAECHVPELRIQDPIFSEPSTVAAFRDPTFPPNAGASIGLAAFDMNPTSPLTFDLTRDIPDNENVTLPSGQTLGAFERDSATGEAIVRLFADFKRHDLGADLADPVDVFGVPASVFLTEPLWGVGSTAPYLHDGRAVTLSEAILLHGGDAKASRDGFAALSTAQQNEVVAFLEDMVLFKNGEGAD